MERTFLSAHIHQTETSQSIIRVTPRLTAASPIGKRKVLSTELPEQGRQECLPHLQTRFFYGSTSSAQTVRAAQATNVIEPRPEPFPEGAPRACGP